MDFLLIERDYVFEVMDVEDSGNLECDLDKQEILMVDSALNKFKAGIGIFFITQDLSSIEHAIHLEFLVSNNKVNFEVLIADMLMATELRVKNLKICSDSSLVIGQMTGKFQVKDERMLRYKVLVERLMMLFKRKQT